MTQDSGCCFRLAYRQPPQSRRRNLLAGELPQVAGHCSARRRTCSIACAALGDVVLLAGDVADDVADDAAPGTAWLAHAVMPSPHAATAKKPKMTERSRTAALVSVR